MTHFQVRSILLLCGIVAAAAAGPAAAQPQRPRIGIALGGGTAKGLAHIGVLEWLDEHRVPVDMIAGTSMGGLIAGSYASGMTPREIRELMRTTDWDLMFLADSPYRAKTFRRKQDRRAYQARLEFGVKDGLRLSPGQNPGQLLALMLDAIALPYYSVGSFDDLPTPFRAVATDLRTSELVVLGQGSLARAMRATMAIPGVFTPVNIEPWLLVDGGALNNIPGDVTRDMGADVVVVVNVGTDRPTEQQVAGSLFSLLGQTVSAMMAVGIQRGLASADVVIDPDMAGLDGTSWKRVDELADRGYRAAAVMAAALERYTLSEADYAAFKAARAARRRAADAVPTSIEVTGVPEAEQQYLEDQLSGNVNRPVDASRLAGDILAIAGTDRYESLSYRLDERPGGPALSVNARPKTYGPPFVAMGLELNNISSSSFAVSLGARLTSYDTFGKGTEARTDFVVGTRQAVGLEVYRPIGLTRAFVAPRAYASRGLFNLVEEDRQVAEYRVTRAGLGADLGVSASRRSEFRFGVDLASVRAILRVGTPVLPEVEGWEGAARAQFTFDGQDSPTVPTRGAFVRARLTRFLSTPDRSPEKVDPALFPDPESFGQGEATLSAFAPLRGGDRAFGVLAFGSSFGARPTFNTFSLGGPLRLGAYSHDELRGANYMLAAGGLLKRTGRLPDVLGGHTFVGGWFEAGSAFNDWGAIGWKGSASIGMLLESQIGPIFAGGSLGFDGRTRLYVAIGPVFR